jgi:hypothetical protein
MGAGPDWKMKKARSRCFEALCLLYRGEQSHRAFDAKDCASSAEMVTSFSNITSPVSADAAPDIAIWIERIFLVRRSRILRPSDLCHAGPCRVADDSPEG